MKGPAPKVRPYVEKRPPKAIPAVLIEGARGLMAAVPSFIAKIISHIKAMIHGKMTTKKIAVLAYGSLLAHPGEWLGKNMIELVRCETPFPVEYAGRAQKGRGGAPTLVKVPNGIPVRGGLIVLDVVDSSENLNKVRNELGKREDNLNFIRDDLTLMGYRVVYSDFEAKIADADLTAKNLARYAVESVVKCLRARHPWKNGIRYLLENLEWGVVTKLTMEYQTAILELTNTTSLEEAEATVLLRTLPR